MTKFSDVPAAGVTIRESANDGSDFSNPSADYRRLFLGEDGLLHLKDSAGAVTDIGGAAGITVEDEGTPLATAATTLDFVGAGVTASGTGAEKTITIPGGGGVSHAYAGYNTIGGSTEAGTQYRWYMKKISLASAGLIASIGAYLDQTSIDLASGFYAAVWEDNAGTARYLLAGGLLGDGPVWLQHSAGSAGDPRWVTVPIGLWIPAAGDYWIGVSLGSTNATGYSLYYNDTGVDDKYFTPSGVRFVDAGRLTVNTATDKHYSIRASFLT